MSVDALLDAVKAAAKSRKEAPASDSSPTVGEALEAKRNELGLTAREFAVVVGLESRHYNEVVSGKRPLTMKAAKRAYAIGVSAQALLG